MIGEAELRRRAAQTGTDVSVLDLDYGLGWFLAGWFSQPEVRKLVVLKGGTCLRKCYFADYRFSEDLDFTLTGDWSLAGIEAAVVAVQQWSIEASGPGFRAAAPYLETVRDRQGQTSFQVRVYHRGALRWGGPPRAIQLDISQGEPLAFPTEARPLHHPYSDASALPAIDIPCYGLTEVLAEKLRAISGQRRFAISRDLYDIYRLVQNGVSLDAVRPVLAGKFAAKGLRVGDLTRINVEARRASFHTDWERRLRYLLPPHQMVDFDVAWQTAIQAVAYLER